ncbi:flagellar basal body rod protein FlgC [Zooshikella marina]|uniref:Flagellar basal-body rod protein FlgC n=1 Tax=Zooshikella ganghwensis TaxID=202772 RepID=A0A4P9VMA4_9GAMM|nr:flagellar basal body rod protein FlgC [Zooshikella ganghwensis]MBU2704575.1 flagellar basal body rod protein FlgC [Zooshikella ganghwensis]RDH43240.1 flagellar basal body rod protein FlgC [Zooshikella ganghwensis]
MSLTNIFNISGSGMSAQSVRLNTIASNVANAETASSSINEVYQGRKPFFKIMQTRVNEDPFWQGSVFDDENTLYQQQGRGVMVQAIVESKATPQARYEPDHPKADEKGYVYYPNINVVEEMTDMISASRSFQVNVEIMNTAKTMLQKVLTLGQ